jgi:hypothetical protein
MDIVHGILTDETVIETDNTSDDDVIEDKQVSVINSWLASAQSGDELSYKRGPDDSEDKYYTKRKRVDSANPDGSSTQANFHTNSYV